MSGAGGRDIFGFVRFFSSCDHLWKLQLTMAITNGDARLIAEAQTEERIEVTTSGFPTIQVISALYVAGFIGFLLLSLYIIRSSTS